MGENGQYFAWNLAKGVRDETVGKPLNLIRDWGLRGESGHDIGKGGTLSKYGDSLGLVVTLLVLSRFFDGLGNWVEKPLQTGSPAVT